MDIDRLALEEWQKNQPLAILQLDPSDRVVLRVAGKKQLLLVYYVMTILGVSPWANACACFS